MFEYIETKIRDKFGDADIITEPANTLLAAFGLSDTLQLIDRERLGNRGFYVINSYYSGVGFQEFTRGTNDDNCFIFPYMNHSHSKDLLENVIELIYKEVERRGYNKEKLRFYLLYAERNYSHTSIIITEQR